MRVSKIFVRLIGVLTVLMLLCVPAVSNAQPAKDYVYDRIDFSYEIQPDSTIKVSEVITYDFTGQYHTAYRDLRLHMLDDISDVQVYEWTEYGDVPLSYSYSAQDKNNPASWNSYTVHNVDSVKRIQWYFDAKDTKKTWRINYVLHGAVSFLKNKDELYWNLFDSFEAPIRSMQALVLLPEAVSHNNVQATQYTSIKHNDDDISTEYIATDSEKTDRVLFTLKNIQRYEVVTIAVGWPKGLVSQKAYLIDALRLFWPYLLSILIIVATAAYLIPLWYIRERKGRKKTVIAEYEPPNGFTPAMAYVICNEGVSAKVWSATIVDLAVRGYITIEEDPYQGFGQSFVNKFLSKDFKIYRAKPNDALLREYEVKYLDVLMPNDKAFSTRSYRTSGSRRIAREIEKIERSLYKEVSDIPDIYEVSIYTEDKKKIFKGTSGLNWIRWIVLGLYLVGSVFAGLVQGNIKYGVLAVVVILALLVIRRYGKYEARLTMAGEDLKYKILGFKEFLDVTGKDRMQNLTPEMFEKYLPFAMIFGVEKTWAKKFDSMHLGNPDWYKTNALYYSGGYGGGNVSGNTFSVSAFSASLSSSFSSAISSSGGGGASGGGGGAGGGGGGGGGGAS